MPLANSHLLTRCQKENPFHGFCKPARFHIGDALGVGEDTSIGCGGSRRTLRRRQAAAYRPTPRPYRLSTKQIPAFTALPTVSSTLASGQRGIAYRVFPSARISLRQPPTLGINLLVRELACVKTLNSPAALYS
jgi:hypothetical protein